MSIHVQAWREAAAVTLHLHIPPKTKRPRCDTRALAELRARVRADLESNKIERQISKQLVDRHNE
jgi:hypothetical protein